ncbi:MAG: nucleoside triphosphate pyrophosphohydrolase family protein [Flavobacteriales bacterium]|nr:nucleoside triphosphate pyrophosphohydrolase family protein [Flavobacteriales bacterium]
MKKKLEMVQFFHKTFGIGIGNDFKEKLDEDKVYLRYNLMHEENKEYLDAALEGNFVEVADALGDQLYVLLGTILEHGMHDVIDEVFDEIHKSNMSKLGNDGKPIYREDGKALKGENYATPKISNILK